MSLTDVLEAIRVLTHDEQEQVRELLEGLNHESRIDRFKRLRGSARDDRFESLTLEDFKIERREIWKSLIE